MGFVFHPTTIFKNLYPTENHHDQLNQLTEKIDRIELELSKKRRARNNLYKLLEKTETNLEDLYDRINSNNQEIVSLNSKLNESQSKYQELKSIIENKEVLSKFLRNNKKFLAKRRRDIRKLNYNDRKLLIESSLVDKVIVNYDDGGSIDPDGVTCEFKLACNFDTLRKFVEEGQITKLDKNSTNNSSRHEF